MSELIKREDAIKITWIEPQYSDPINVLTEVRERIEALPTIDAVPVVHGEWEETDDRWGVGKWRCSACEKHSKEQSDYCPNCGAKMDGKEQSNESND